MLCCSLYMMAKPSTQQSIGVRERWLRKVVFVQRCCLIDKFRVFQASWDYGVIQDELNEFNDGTDHLAA